MQEKLVSIITDGWFRNAQQVVVPETLVTDTIDNNWKHSGESEISEPIILFDFDDRSTSRQTTPEIIGLLVPMRHLEEIRNATVTETPLPSDTNTEENTSTAYYCALFKRFNLKNLKDIIYLYGIQATRTASCYHSSFILENVANTEKTDLTPLHILCACYSYAQNMKDLIDLVIESGSDVNAKAGEEEINALHLLCRYYRGENLLEMIDYLIQKGVSPHAKKRDGMNAFRYLCQTYRGHNLKEILEFLIDKYDIDTSPEKKTGASHDKDSSDFSALQLVCAVYRGTDLKQTMEMLICKDSNSFATPPGEFCALMLLCATYSGDDLKDLLDLLIEKGVSKADAKNSVDGCNALHYLCGRYKGQHLNDLIEFLLDNGIDVNDKAGDGSTALLLLCASYTGDDLKKIIETFIRRGADVSCCAMVPNYTVPQTALNYIAHFNYYRRDLKEIVELLLANGVNSRITGYNCFPVSVICFNYRGPDRLEIVRLIVQDALDNKNYDKNGFLESLRDAQKVNGAYNLDLGDTLEVHKCLWGACVTLSPESYTPFFTIP